VDICEVSGIDSYSLTAGFHSVDAIHLNTFPIQESNVSPGSYLKSNFPIQYVVVIIFQKKLCGCDLMERRHHFMYPSQSLPLIPAADCRLSLNVLCKSSFCLF
jgi:hypothetical protein